MTRPAGSLPGFPAGSGRSGVVFVHCGHDPSKAFQFSLESEALREFVRQGAEALREMDEMFAREQADAACS